MSYIYMYCVKAVNTILIRERLEERRILLPFFCSDALHNDKRFRMFKKRNAIIRAGENDKGFSVRVIRALLILHNIDPTKERVYREVKQRLTTFFEEEESIESF